MLNVDPDKGHRLKRVGLVLVVVYTTSAAGGLVHQPAVFYWTIVFRCNLFN